MAGLGVQAVQAVRVASVAQAVQVARVGRVGPVDLLHLAFLELLGGQGAQGALLAREALGVLGGLEGLEGLAVHLYPRAQEPLVVRAPLVGLSVLEDPAGLVAQAGLMALEVQGGQGGLADLLEQGSLVPLVVLAVLGAH